MATEKKVLAGTNLAGMSTTRDRVDNDFYATPRNAIEAIKWFNIRTSSRAGAY